MAVSVTTRERVKRRITLKDPSVPDTQMDTLLDALILAVTDAFERRLELPLTAAAQTEVHSIDAFQRSIWLRTYYGQEMTAPTITSVKARSTFTVDWGDVAALDADTYALSSDRPGLLLYNAYFPAGEDTVQVVLASSGFAADTAAFIAAYPAMADAADSQIVYEYQRRKDPGKNTTVVQGSTSTEPEVRLLASVLDRLQPYRRVWF